VLRTRNVESHRLQRRERFCGRLERTYFARIVKIAARDCAARSRRRKACPIALCRESRTGEAEFGTAVETCRGSYVLRV